MKTSQNCINLIKRFEGCRLQAYKPVAAEPCYTIGYGHYGSDVRPSMVISQAQAEAYLVQDLMKYEKSVNSLGIPLNQNQFDALVSFTYNCGSGNLKKLVKGRNHQQIADAMLAYNKGSGKVLPGLTKRRQAERTLFLSGTGSKAEQVDDKPKTGNPYPEPTKNVRLNSRGNDVRWLQYQLNTYGYRLIVDGVAGNLTIGALIDFQRKHGLTADGVCGSATRVSLS